VRGPWTRYDPQKPGQNGLFSMFSIGMLKQVVLNGSIAQHDLRRCEHLDRIGISSTCNDDACYLASVFLLSFNVERFGG